MLAILGEPFPPGDGRTSCGPTGEPAWDVWECRRECEIHLGYGPNGKVEDCAVIAERPPSRFDLRAWLGW